MENKSTEQMVIDIIKTYPSIVNAKHTFDRVKPVMEAIFKYKESGERFTAMMIGEAIMGDAYHGVTTNYCGDRVRTSKARSLSSTIGHALHALRKSGIVNHKIEKDLEHPHTFEDKDIHYVLAGSLIPDLLKVKINGSEICIKACDIVGVERKWIKTNVTRYPKVVYYSFK